MMRKRAGYSPVAEVFFQLGPLSPSSARPLLHSAEGGQLSLFAQRKKEQPMVISEKPSLKSFMMMAPWT